MHISGTWHIWRRMTDAEAVAEMRALTRQAIANHDAAQIMTDCAGLLDQIKREWGGEWSDWDQGVRDRITAWLKARAYPEVTAVEG
jgi:hypothetical protein